MAFVPCSLRSSSPIDAVRSRTSGVKCFPGIGRSPVVVSETSEAEVLGQRFSFGPAHKQPHHLWLELLGQQPHAAIREEDMKATGRGSVLAPLPVGGGDVIFQIREEEVVGISRRSSVG
ncbi:MAG: hypothetical protein KatS3mg112_0169 [Thermogutta sp.]|nr:MAG: hypothetical protein KatS3mg112_0169 [Thermogutta sp.]